MFIVLMRYTENQAQKAELQAGHIEWVKAGMNDGVFLLAGGLPPAQGGCIFADNLSATELEARLQQDPYVIHGVVAAEVVELKPAMALPPLECLLPG